MKKYYIKTQYRPGWQATVLSEVTEHEIKELLKNNPELLNNSVATPTYKRKYFVPKVGEEYYYITYNDHIGCTNYFETGTHNNVKSGNCFATEQDAQDELNRRQALVRIWTNFDDKYSWDIDWEDIHQYKYFICYDTKNKDFEIGANGNRLFTFINRQTTELPYFKSAEDRNQFVEENEKDLLTIFNIKK